MKILVVSLVHVEHYVVALLVALYAESFLMACPAFLRICLRRGLVFKSPVHLVVRRLHPVLIVTHSAGVGCWHDRLLGVVTFMATLPIHILPLILIVNMTRLAWNVAWGKEIVGMHLMVK